jgi:hypothetical protein
MTNSTLATCWTGKSAGFVPLRILPAYGADLTIGAGNIGSVAHQATGGGELAHSVNCRHRVAGRQRHDLSALASEKRVDADNEVAIYYAAAKTLALVAFI